MFFHGINWEYVKGEYPLLSPRRTVSRKRHAQMMDRLHLVQQFGLEPIHLLESDEDYSDEECVHACLAFGDTVFAFARLPLPLWQLSQHEVGVEVLDLRTCCRIYCRGHLEEAAALFPGVPCLAIQQLISFPDSIDPDKKRHGDRT